MTPPVEAPAPSVSRRDFVKGAAAAAAAASVLAAPVPGLGAAVKKPKPGPKLPDGPLHDLQISEAAPLVASGRLSPVDIALAFLERIEAVDPRVQAFVNRYPDADILAQARAAERLLRRGRHLGPLHGITVALKDIYLTQGYVTEGNSKLYTGYVPPFDAESVARLKAAGVTIMGKVGTSELATATASAARNPWDLERTPGGSSSGSAAGLAASEFMVGMGTCTGGSIRGPAANCGLSGFKPTYGTVSLHGILPLAWSMDHPGPLCHSALDCALVVDAVGGADPKDPLSRPVKRYSLAKRLLAAPSRKPLRGVVVGVPAADDFLRGVPNDDELAAFEEAVTVVKAQGATVRTVTTEVLLPGLTSVSSFYDIIRSHEVAAYQHVNLVTQPQNMSQAYIDRVAPGVLMPGHAYSQAQRVRRLWIERFLRVFQEVDVLIHPADNIAGLIAGGGTPSARRSSGSKTNIWNLSGAPAIAIPTGISGAEGMPLSMQCAAAPGDDALALLVAHGFQMATGFHTLRPALEVR
ncbi:amidase [Miltoncostaea marina]|uniref:amidase n=1 Tax=Miltoncostaea marina TaxID=2843215 RepID=UPI001C3E7A96|nr:amidase [Miltoncostaea marina]